MQFKLLTIVSSAIVISLTLVFVLWKPVKSVDEASWTQTDWSGGSGQSSWSDTSSYLTSSNTNNSVVGQLSLTATSSWYNTNWKYRKKISFDNSSQSENLANFPVLIKLDLDSDIDYTKTQNNGQDIRFTDSDGTTVLAHEIESWDEAGSSYVWVKVPQINGTSTTDNIYMYYGNDAATDGQSVSSVWSNNYSGVYHLAEDPTVGVTQIKDSVLNQLDGTAMGSMTSNDQSAGKINGSLDFDGNDDFLTFGNKSFVDGASAMSVCIWIKYAPESVTVDGVIAGEYSGIPPGWLLWVDNVGAVFGNQNTIAFSVSPGSGAAARVEGQNNIVETNIWSYYCGVFQGSTHLKLYKNGVLNSENTSSIVATVDSSSEDLRIGKWGGGANFNGSIDEVTIAPVARSVDWIAASYKSQTDTFNSYASEEERFAASGTLTSSIFDTTQLSDWGTLNVTTSGTGTVSIKARTGNSSDLSDASLFSSCSAISSGTDISSANCVSDRNQYIQYQVSLQSSESSTPVLESVDIGYSASDVTGPVIASLSTDSSDTGAAITWTTNEISSSQIDYGLTSSYGNSTSQTDTSPRVTDHSVSLSNLRACTRYHYRARSSDTYGNGTSGSDTSFTTTGCIGSATVESQVAASVDTILGGQTTLTSNGLGVSLTVPSGFYSTDLEFQVKKLSKAAVITALSTPTNYQAIGDHVYDFSALSTVDTAVSSFDENIAVSITYSDDQISNMAESSLYIYRWTGSSWQRLATTVDTQTNTASAQTNQFSTFILFGLPESSANTTSSNDTSTNSSGSGGAPTCDNETPGSKAPHIYAAVAKSSEEIQLYFSEADDPLDTYVLSFGTKPGEYQFGAENIGGRGTRSFVVSQLRANTEYYFRVRAGNGCAAGPWSNEISAKTLTLTTINRLLVSDTQLSTMLQQDSNQNQTEEVVTTEDAEVSSVLSDHQTLKIKIVDDQQHPLRGAQIILHSEPKYGTTNEQGEVTFTDVETGQHRLIIAYEGYNGEEQLDLFETDQPEYQLQVQVRLSRFPNRSFVYSIIIISILVNLVLLIIIWRSKLVRT